MKKHAELGTAKLALLARSSAEGIWAGLDAQNGTPLVAYLPRLGHQDKKDMLGKCFETLAERITSCCRTAKTGKDRCIGGFL